MCGISRYHNHTGVQMIFKPKNWFRRNRNGIKAGTQIVSFFLFEIVVIIIKTITESIHHTNDSIDQRRSEIWKAYKRG
jgi:hypothetical protein